VRFATGKQRIFLLKIHDVGEPAYEETWLRKNATLTAYEEDGIAELLIFKPSSGPLFYWPRFSDQP